MTTTTRPLYRNMTPEGLYNAYHDTRRALANASAMNHAAGVIRLARDLDLIVNVARKRGISLR